jgi:hypothetical protein
MTEWLFRVASLAAFAADLDGFTQAMGYQPLTQGGAVLPGAIFQDKLRFDFDLIDNMVTVDAVLDGSGNVVTPPVTKGPHVNAKATVLPSADPVAASAALAALEGQLAAFFAALPLGSYDGGAHSWHATSGRTIFIDPPPAVRRRVWA